MHNVCISSRQTSASHERSQSFKQSLLFFTGCHDDESWRIALGVKNDTEQRGMRQHELRLLCLSKRESYIWVGVFHKWWQNESAEMRFLRLSWHVEMRVCALTCRHVTQFRLSASMTRAKAREAIFRPSHRDSTKGMLPTCQSQLKQSSNIPSNVAITVCLCWCPLPASRSKALWEPVRARHWRQADNSM